MKLNEAADVYETVAPKVEEMADELKQLREAEQVLKDYFKRTGRRSYRGRIGCKLGTQKRFEQGIAKELLGPSKVEKCMVDRRTASVFLLTPVDA